ncbi:unnamed protein product [Adineta steineri]|uniref:J domain-containing protein n=1 Tax=Adineta steineri TaxID=433720 RepID=A0A818I9S6_9BILA|nr:unnamed protein product [Adineta steineri]
MQRLIKFPNRLSTFVWYRTLTHDSTSSSTNTRTALPFSFDENKALDYFNRWRKSFWLAPNDWQQTPVTITQRYLPCWSFSLTGTVFAEAYIKRGAWIWGGTEWHPLADEISLPNINLSDINVYAAHNYDRQHILEIDMKTNESLESIDISSLNSNLIEEWTVDRDTAFEIGWDLQIVKKIQDMCIKELNKQRKGEYRITSIRFPINKEIQKLIYFPVYTIDYQYRNRQLQCLINGRTGQVAGLRQFSRLKSTALIMGVIYPTCILSLISILSFAFYATTRHFVIVPVALFSIGLTLPVVSLAALQLGKYIRDYSHLYRGKRDIREWLAFKKENPYIFTEKNFQQRDAPPIFNRQRTEEPRKETFAFDMGPDLYGLLGVSRVASEPQIKRAYLLKAKEFHPDRNVGNKQIEEQFKLINQAYAILSNTEQRQIYDEYGYDHVKYK